MKPYWSYGDRIKPVELIRGVDMAPVSVFKSFKNHTRFLWIHSNGPSVIRIRPRLVRLYVRFTRMANRISLVFCVRQALAVCFISIFVSDDVFNTTTQCDSIWTQFSLLMETV